MPNIDQIIAAKKESLNPKINAILPSEGIPGSTGGRNSTLTSWTEIQIYPDGATKLGRVVSGSGSASDTWVLPLPQDLSEPHSLQYEPIEFGAIARIGANIMGNQQINTNDPKSVEAAENRLGSRGFLESAKQVIIGIGEEALGFAVTQQAVNYLRGTLRNTANPNMENLFKTANLRTFQFSWNLTPLSETDANAIKSFVSSIRKNIYPENIEIGQGWNRLNFPSEFVITFNSMGYAAGGTPNKIFQTAPCVCTDFVVQYTPNGAFNTHIDGLPTSVAINATFQEMYSLHRGDIEALEK